MLNVQAGTVGIMPPIQALPIPKLRLNNNLLSLLSIIVLGLMLLTVTYSIAQVCQSEQRALNNAQIAHGATGTALIMAEAALVVAIATGNLVAIAVAAGFVASAMLAHRATAGTLAAALQDYLDCLERAGQNG